MLTIELCSYRTSVEHGVTRMSYRDGPLGPSDIPIGIEPGRSRLNSQSHWN